MFIIHPQPLTTLFWISLFFIFYTYAGYGLLLFILVKLFRNKESGLNTENHWHTPSLTLMVAAFNEKNCIADKIKNCLELAYPKDKLHFIFITDGSTDGTHEIVSQYPQLYLLHESERKGKMAAINRAMKEVKTELVVFTDANSLINPDALLLMSRHFLNEKTGAVAGEKRIDIRGIDDATAGEGFYWKYESMLKKWESEWYSVMGAAGELFCIRTELYEAIEPDTLLDDFMISMHISLKGFRVTYEPGAKAMETASVSISEELKRKIRIGAGAFQALFRLKSLLFSFRYPMLSFEYLSHRVFRWVLAPFLLVSFFAINLLIVSDNPHSWIFLTGLFIQSFFYLMALLGWVFAKNQTRFRLFFTPFYFCLMNYALVAGMFRYVFNTQSVIWQKAGRKI